VFVKKLWRSMCNLVMVRWCYLTVLHPYTEHSKPGAVLLGIAADFNFPAGVIPSSNRGGVLSRPGGLESIARMVVSRTKSKRASHIYNAGMLDDMDDFEDLNFDDVQLVQYLKSLIYLKSGHFPVVLGGGHAISIASYQALSDHLYHSDYVKNQRWYAAELVCSNINIGIINFDSNFELRLTPSPKLDSVFHAVNSYCQSISRPFNYLGLGISKHTNPDDAFLYAEQLGCDWLLDKHMSKQHAGLIEETLLAFLDKVEHIHLSFDLSVFCYDEEVDNHSGRVQGVNWSTVEFALGIIARSGKVRMLDIVALNPELEYSELTATYMADIIATVLQHRQL
jgi:formiminoglutamase